MRKDRFIKLLGSYLPRVRKSIKGLDYDERNEVTSQAVESMLRNKLYATVQDKSMKAFVRRAIQFQRQKFLRSEQQRKQVFKRMPEEQDTDFLLIQEDRPEEEITRCPFCFDHDLNQYGACANCHTILPSHLCVHKKDTGFELLPLSVDLHYDRQTDVRNAFNLLLPHEQAVVKAIIVGNENFGTLSSIAELGDTPWDIRKIWLQAKAKLQARLSDYARKTVQKHGGESILRALNYAK
jgi:hypothetical protein